MIKACVPIVALFFLCGQWNLFAENGEEKLRVRYLFSFPEAKEAIAQLSDPQAIAVNQEGHVFIVDTGHSRIVKFDQYGNFILANGGFGWEPEQFDRPLDVTAETGLDIFIADYNNERIERYDNNLNYISSFETGDAVAEELRFGFPTGVDISRHGELFICDTENNRILKLDTEGRPVVSFGDFNWGAGQLRFPNQIEIAQNDLVYVSDRAADQIVVFDYYGNYVSKFGGEVLQNPGGLVWSDNRSLWIADTGHNQIAVFDKAHRLIYSWGSEGEKIGAFRSPVDVAWFNGKVYVLESGNARVQVFERLPAKNKISVIEKK